MRKFLSFKFILLISLLVQSEKLQVSVYYEALCVDSVYFFTRQLIPTYNEYGDKMDLKLIPYGKASHYWNKDENKYEFLCQHGPNECLLNKIHACALDVLPFQSSLTFINCLMGKFHEDMDETIRHCSPSDVTELEKCMKTRKDELLAGHGNATMKIGLTFVPTIVPQNDTCYKRRDSLYSNFRQAFRDEYAAKFQKYPDDEELNEIQKTKVSNLCEPVIPH
ncbi:GILT-like protein 3 [Phlebotomus papatasi]|uniref:GILT-like protein 3 n=1 Tax=Phlebotomus papatasi TaxID=29031 RepID=UPI0024840E9D|nr:GILT-like protein 3 [Phlebotomus papatasi]